MLLSCSIEGMHVFTAPCVSLHAGRELYSGSPGAGVNLVLHGEPDKHTGLNHYRSIVDIVGVPIELFTSRYFRVS